VAVTLAVFLVVLGKAWSSRHASAPAQAAQPTPTTHAATAATAQPAVPKADFDAYYVPKTKPAPELLEPVPAK